MTPFDITGDLRQAHMIFCPEQVADVPAMPSSDVLELRKRLIEEEMAETERAIAAGDLVEFADGVADVLYVTVGTAVACGVDIGREWKLVGGSDDPFADVLERVRESGHMPTKMGLPAAIERVNEVFFTQAYVKAALAAAALFEAFEQGDVARCTDPLLRMTAALCELSVRAGIDLRLVWAEVHRTNLAKQGGTRRVDGKFLKPPGWTPPDIRKVLDTQGPLL